MKRQIRILRSQNDEPPTISPATELVDDGRCCRSDGEVTYASGASGNLPGMCKDGAAMAAASVARKQEEKRLIQSDLTDCFSEKFDSVARRHGHFILVGVQASL